MCEEAVEEARKLQKMYECVLQASNSYHDLAKQMTSSYCKLLHQTGRAKLAKEVAHNTALAMEQINNRQSVRFLLPRNASQRSLRTGKNSGGSANVFFHHTSLFQQKKNSKIGTMENSGDAFVHSKDLISICDGVGGGGYLSAHLSSTLCDAFFDCSQKNPHLLRSAEGMSILARETECVSGVRCALDKKEIGMIPSTTMTAISVADELGDLVINAIEIGDSQWALLQMTQTTSGQALWCTRYLSDRQMYKDGRKIPLQVSAFHPLSWFFGNSSGLRQTTLKKIPTGIKVTDITSSDTQHFVLVASDGFWVNFFDGMDDEDYMRETLSAKLESATQAYLTCHSLSKVMDSKDLISFLMQRLSFEIYENCVPRKADDDVTFSISKISSTCGQGCTGKLEDFLAKVCKASIPTKGTRKRHRSASPEEQTKPTRLCYDRSRSGRYLECTDDLRGADWNDECRPLCDSKRASSDKIFSPPAKDLRGVVWDDECRSMRDSKRSSSDKVVPSAKDLRGVVWDDECRSMRDSKRSSSDKVVPFATDLRDEYRGNPAEMRLDGYKTRMCKFTLDQCFYGKGCVFAHSEEELRCKEWARTGMCCNNVCSKRHSIPFNFREAKCYLETFERQQTFKAKAATRTRP